MTKVITKGLANYPTWYVMDSDGYEYLSSNLEFLLDEYVQLFGEEIVNKTPCIVFNEPSSTCPMFIHSQPLLIRLSQSGLSYWAQTIFQLSHELSHYVMYQARNGIDMSLSWFEEIICEAMSLFALHYASANWNRCKLSNMNPGFHKSIQEYLKNQLASAATDGLRQCTSVAELTAYEKNKMGQSDRAGHTNERNAVYYAILHNPSEIACVLNYYRYIIPEKNTIDFDKWYSDMPYTLVHQLESIQPTISEETCDA